MFDHCTETAEATPAVPQVHNPGPPAPFLHLSLLRELATLEMTPMYTVRASQLRCNKKEAVGLVFVSTGTASLIVRSSSNAYLFGLDAGFLLIFVPELGAYTVTMTMGNVFTGRQ